MGIGFVILLALAVFLNAWTLLFIVYKFSQLTTVTNVAVEVPTVADIMTQYDRYQQDKKLADQQGMRDFWRSFTTKTEKAAEDAVEINNYNIKADPETLKDYLSGHWAETRDGWSEPRRYFLNVEPEPSTDTEVANDNVIQIKREKTNKVKEVGLAEKLNDGEAVSLPVTDIINDIKKDNK